MAGIIFLMISCVRLPGIPTAAPSTKGLIDFSGYGSSLSIASFIEGHPYCYFKFKEYHLYSAARVYLSLRMISLLCSLGYLWLTSYDDCIRRHEFKVRSYSSAESASSHTHEHVIDGSWEIFKHFHGNSRLSFNDAVVIVRMHVR